VLPPPPMTQTEITLKYDRKQFESIYFRNKNGNIFIGPSTKYAFLLFSIVGLLFLLLVLYSISTNQLYVVTFLLFLGFSVSLYHYWKQVSNVLLWKRSIINYLDDLEKYISFKIILTDHSFVYIQDTTESIEKWTSIKNATFKETFISFQGSQSYLFPKGSMSDSQYSILWEFVSNKMKNE